MNLEVPGGEDFSEVASDPIVQALDGLQVRGARRKAWVARVNSVYRDERACWVQISKEGDATASVLLRCSRSATADHITATLAQWPARRATSLRVLRVMSAA